MQETLDKIVNNYIKENPEIITPLTKIIVGERINSGGTSIVHEATFENSSKKFVIKFLLENIKNKETSAYKRFKQSYINLQLVQNSNIFLPQIYFHTLIISDEFIIPFTIMPLAEDTLFSYYNNKAMDFDLWINIFNDLGQKIEYMHKQNIIHRDLKPQNLFLLNSNILIGDCDIASFDKDKYIKIIDTKKSDRLGNFSFSAPEQAEKDIDEITPAADWYAFGQIMYWLLFKKTIRGIQDIDLHFKNPIYNTIIRKLLSQNPIDRFQNFNEIQKFITMSQENKSRQESINRQYEHAIKTVNLFDEIIYKYTCEVNTYEPCIKTIINRDEINDIIYFLKENCDQLSLWISQGHSDLEIKKISFDPKNENYCFGCQEMKIEKILIFRLGIIPGGSLILLITKSQQSLSQSSYEDEEIIYYKDRIISRAEYDNGWAMIDGKRIKLNNEDCKITLRTLYKTVYFISPQMGLFQENSEIFEIIHNEFLKNNSLDEDYFFEKLKKSKRARLIRFYE